VFGIPFPLKAQWEFPSQRTNWRSGAFFSAGKKKKKILAPNMAPTAKTRDRKKKMSPGRVVKSHRIWLWRNVIYKTKRIRRMGVGLKLKKKGVGVELGGGNG